MTDAQKERAAVVAWLREESRAEKGRFEAQTGNKALALAMSAITLAYSAAAIEGGFHLTTYQEPRQ